MTGALLYLELTSRKNAIRQRLLRLKQPRYLAAAIIGAAYFYFFVFRGVLRGVNATSAPSPLPEGGDLLWRRLLEPLGALFLFVGAALSWLLARGRAALAFTEAEVAVLFPAPVTRRTLIHYKLLRSQLGILMFSVLMAFFSRRWLFLGGSGWIRAVGWWVIISTFNLHMIGASFLRDRLLEMGLNPRRRRWAAAVVLVLLAAGTWWWLRGVLPAPGEVKIATAEDLFVYVGRILAAPPLAWVLYPFRLVVRPFLAADAPTFIRALGPVALLYAAHYWWVLRADVAFEEASLALAQKQAALRRAMKEGRLRPRTGARKRRSEPFTLRAHGPRPLAFLWKALIDAGPLFYPRSWLIAGGVLIGGVFLLGQSPATRPASQVLGVVSGVLCGYGLVLAPMVVRRGFGRTMERFEVLKSYPLRGWQVVLGELLCPLLLLSLFEWVLLPVVVLSGRSVLAGKVALSLQLAGAVGAGLLVPPLAGLMFAIPFSAMLYFPAWIGAMNQAGGGIEVAGQRLLFLAAYVFLFLLGLLPAAVAGLGPFLLARVVTGSVAAGILAAAGAAVLALTAEFGVVLWWLGGRFEAFDLSHELPH